MPRKNAGEMKVFRNKENVLVLFCPTSTGRGETSRALFNVNPQHVSTFARAFNGFPLITRAKNTLTL